MQSSDRISPRSVLLKWINVLCQIRLTVHHATEQNIVHSYAPVNGLPRGGGIGQTHGI